MNKQEIINTLQEILITHESWGDQGQVLIDGINLDRLMEPVKLNECDFSIWNAANKHNILAFPWYEDLVKGHDKLHTEFSNLLYDAMRKYNPKTRDELINEYKSFESDLSEFNKVIDDTKQRLWDMSEEDFTATVAKSHEQSVEAEIAQKQAEIENNTNIFEELDEIDSVQASDEQGIKIISIDEFDENEEQAETILDSKNKYSKQADETIVSTNKFISEFKAITKDINSTDNLNKHISLKELNLKQLQQEIKLTKQEFSHLEETQNLTNQGVTQLQQHFELKKQEIELEQLDNEKLLELNTNARDKTKEQLTIIEEKTVSLNNVITDLEDQNSEDRIKLDEDRKTKTIEKQFEVLKSNKSKDLERLQEQLVNRKTDQEKLTEQLRLLEEEISEMEQDINIKQHGIADLEEKERIKNKERTEQFEEQERMIERRYTSIKTKLKELDGLSADADSTRNELEDFDQHIKSMTKEFENVLLKNMSELQDIEFQQEQKNQKLIETKNLKTTKTEEIDQIEVRIKAAENALEELKSELNFADGESNSKPKIQLEKETV